MNIRFYDSPFFIGSGVYWIYFICRYADGDKGDTGQARLGFVKCNLVPIGPGVKARNASTLGTQRLVPWHMRVRNNKSSLKLS
ncbi:MAG: hypothetical protein WAM14_19675 [Candidatus Nitrosopolaris sp.]